MACRPCEPRHRKIAAERRAQALWAQISSNRLSGILMWQGAQGAIRNALKDRQCCNPPQSAIHHAETATSL
eukprot:14742764-Alexandrium_andersonii.AAC.1